MIETPAFEELWQRNVEESIRQGSTKPFLEEAVLQVSNWGFSLGDLQPQKKCPGKGFLPWLKFLYGEAECEMTGFLGPIHIWQVFPFIDLNSWSTIFHILQNLIKSGLPKPNVSSVIGEFCMEQGMDDLVVPPTMTAYVSRILPNASVHWLPEEGHYSYFFLCDKCHREILTSLFGSPQGPLKETPSEDDEEASTTLNDPLLE